MQNKKMLRYISCCVLLVLFLTINEARPQNNEITDTYQELDSIDTDVEDVRGSYYDLPAQPVYQPNIPYNRLQMLIAQYRPNAYLRSPNWSNSNGLYRMPETKRQVRYRQCYFNPISCFKK